MGEPVMWEVIGGGAAGGILVKEEKDLESSAFTQRLSTGAIVAQLSLQKDRLEYQLVSPLSAGPPTGWVSVAIKGKKLLKKLGGEAQKGASAADGVAASGAMASASKSKEIQDWICSGAGAFQELPRKEPSPEAPLMKSLRSMTAEEIAALPYPTGEQSKLTRKKLAAIWDTQEPGVHYGMLFPHNMPLLKEMGAEWLTKAFHAAGTLPKDNSVTKLKEVIGLSLDSAAGEALGGAAIKVLIVVEYKKPHPELHTELFAKMPTPYSSKNERFQNASNNSDEPEIFLYRLIGNDLGCATPKMYFGEVSRGNMNAIVILEALKFSKVWKPYAEYNPFEVYPMLDKNKDWQIPDRGRSLYAALAKAVARMTAAGQTGRLGSPEALERLFMGMDADTKDRLEKGFPPPALKEPTPELKKYIEDTSEKMMGQYRAYLCVGLDFAVNVCPQCFVPELKDRAFLTRMVREGCHVGQYDAEILMFLYGDKDLYSITHPNLAIDNAFFFNNKDGQVEAGLLDFGGVGFGNPLSSLIRNMIGGEPDVMEDLEEQCVDIFIEEVAAQGGAKLEKGKCMAIARLSQAQYAWQMGANVSQAYTFLAPKKDKVWKEVTGRWDPRIEQVFLTRIYVSNWRNMMAMWKSEKRSPYQAFLKWVKEYSAVLPKKKPLPSDSELVGEYFK